MNTISIKVIGDRASPKMQEAIVFAVAGAEAKTIAMHIEFTQYAVRNNYEPSNRTQRAA